MSWWERGPTVPLGTTRFLWFVKRTVRITPQQARAHMHVLGKTGSGKSYFLAGLFLAMHEAGMPVTLIDPHGDLAELVLTHLVQRGSLPTGRPTSVSCIWTCLPPREPVATCPSTTSSSPTTTARWPSLLLRQLVGPGRSWPPVHRPLRTSLSIP